MMAAIDASHPSGHERCDRRSPAHRAHRPGQWQGPPACSVATCVGISVVWLRMLVRVDAQCNSMRMDSIPKLAACASVPMCVCFVAKVARSVPWCKMCLFGSCSALGWRANSFAGVPDALWSDSRVDCLTFRAYLNSCVCIDQR